MKSKPAKIIFRVLAVLLIAGGTMLSALIASTFAVTGLASAPDPEYIIILGCGLHNGREVSLALEERLETGLEAYGQNPGATIIVSGGQGTDELVSEAAAMRDWLFARGVPENDVIIEDNSHNTFENLLYSQKIMVSRGAGGASALIVTNRFHTTRAYMLACRIGLRSAPVAAATPWQAWHMYIRECAAFFKSLIFDHI